MNSDHISEDIAHQMKISKIVIPILKGLCLFVSNLSFASCIKLHAIQGNVM